MSGWCCRSLVGVAGGATKAAVAQHQALRRNMADLSAKDGSQETLVNLMALCVNLVVLPMVTGDTWLTGGLFLLLTILHIYCNYKAVSCLVMSTMNTARMGAVLDHWRQEGEVLTVIQGNNRESVLWSAGGDGVVLGVSIGELTIQEVSLLESAISKEQNYVVLPSNRGKTRVLLSNKAQTREVYRAYIHAILGEDKPELLTQLEDKGWRLDILALETHGYTYCLPV